MSEWGYGTMARLWTLMVMLIVFGAIHPVVGQQGPVYTECSGVLLEQFQAWDDGAAELLNSLPRSVAEARNQLTGHLEAGMPFGEAGCDAVRAGYFERVARVYAMMTWTTTAALQAFDPNSATYLGDLNEKAERMTDWLRYLPLQRGMSGG